MSLCVELPGNTDFFLSAVTFFEHTMTGNIAETIEKRVIFMLIDMAVSKNGTAE